MNRIFSTSTILAIVVAIAFVLWMASGSLSTTGESRPNTTVSAAPGGVNADSAAANERARISVAVQHSRARLVARDVVVSGRTEPNRSVEIRAEAEGRVIAISAERGAVIAEGQPLAKLDLRDRTARLRETEALVMQHEIQYEAAERLREQNLLSEAQIAEARARLASSEAALTDIRLEIERTSFSAPFDAVIQERMIEIGDFVRIGDAIAELVDTNPLLVVGEVSEREISNLVPGSTGRAVLGDGRKLEGIIRYVAPVADVATRTFKVEMAVANPDYSLRAGITAELQLATDEVQGHLLSPSLLTLNDTGEIGVKIIDDHNRAKFVAVEMLRSTDDGIWVAGLPIDVTIISVGQGFVTDGQIVETVAVDAAAGTLGAK